MVTVMLESVLIIIILFTYLGTPILALTGTADDTTKNTICRRLSLNKDVLKIFISPHRPNNRISVRKVKKDDVDKKT